MYKTLLVGGCARSGTTALREWLNSSPWFYIGDERFTKQAYTSDAFGLDLFDPPRFADVHEDDSYIPQSYVEIDADRIARTVAIGGILGDKIPRLSNIKMRRKLKSDEMKYLIVVRNLFDVASSYKARAEEGSQWAPGRGAMSAVKEWNRAVVWASKQVKKHNAYVLIYENFFFGTDEPRDLYEFLQVPAEHVEALNTSLKSMREESARLETRRLTILHPSERMELCKQGKFGVYRKLLFDSPNISSAKPAPAK